MDKFYELTRLEKRRCSDWYSWK